MQHGGGGVLTASIIITWCAVCLGVHVLCVGGGGGQSIGIHMNV